MLLQKTETFECDDLIADSIIELINKGYSTNYSCSGHVDKKAISGNRINFDTYIMFDRFSSFFMKGMKPNNWVEGYIDNHKVINRYFTFEEDITFTDEQMLQIASQELYNWAKSLEPIEYLYSHITIEAIEGN